ncbi:MAG: DUF5668 domain-containing protein [Acidobacteria bacterium]|nr:DUF5668 domain-containing protein [Acidobacteriota bacterium]
MEPITPNQTDVSMMPAGPAVAENAAPPPEPQQPPPAVVGFCRTCGRPLTDETKRYALGTLFCADHAPSVDAPLPVDPPSPYLATPAPAAASAASPAFAFILGLIPGVGAIYNGQYAKGFVHVLVFGLLTSIVSSSAMSDGFEPLFGTLTAVWVFYMAFEAYHTAKRRAAGEQIDEFSSLIPMAGTSGLPVAPVVLILLGVVFLLGNFGLLRLSQVLRFWPLLLIAAGGVMLANRLKGNSAAGVDREQ